MSRSRIVLYSLTLLLIVGAGIVLSRTTLFDEGSSLQDNPATTETTVEAAISSSSVKIGGTLQIRVRLAGPRIWSVGEARFTVINSDGVKVYDVYVWLPHRTLAPEEDPPQEYVFNLEWKAEKSPTAENVEVTPGSYSFIIALEVEGKELDARGTIEVE